MVNYNTILGVILHACLHFTCLASEGIFPGGGTSGYFPKFFYGGPKVVKLGFYHSKLRKQRFLLRFSNSCPSSDTHVLLRRKSSCHTIKNFGLFQAFYHHPKLLNFTESYTQNEIFDR